ncbi:MAG TPA: hypothetical protein VKH19_07965 [Gemmatimonadaceae bacterium]|nr:hypothetical protein [Gemmatimonadaceae bacterium]
MRRLALVASLLLALLALSPVPALAQNTVTVPPIDFSGWLFGNFQWRTDPASKAASGGLPASRFDVGRAYLTFRMPAGERGSIRVTTDIFQQSPSTYYSGWTVRLKYGYFQYDFTKNLLGVSGLGAVGRVGMIQAVIVDHIENFWPRWLGSAAQELNGFYSSADVGVSSLVTLPKRHGEMYAVITNGSNYSSGETDRFKDFGLRVSLTPFGNDSSFLRTLTISPFYQVGAAGSAFAAPPNSISGGLQKDRRGVFVGLRDRRLQGGAEFSQRVEQVESGVPPARTVLDRTSNLVSGFAIVRPLEIANPAHRSPFSIVGRVDKFDSYSRNTGLPAAVTIPDNTYVVLGFIWDVNARASLALDYQEMKAETTVTGFPTKTLFLHWQATF